jgi:hypothetical protein
MPNRDPDVLMAAIGNLKDRLPNTKPARARGRAGLAQVITLQLQPQWNCLS